MAGRVEGKVALITGAARGQGRAHAVRLAEEGADIIAIDIEQQIDAVPYAMGTAEETAETVRLVEALDRRIVAARADVRDLAGLRAAVDAGVAELGRLDIVSANAGIFSLGLPVEVMEQQTWQDMIDINLTGVYHTAKVTIPHLRASGGGAIVVTSSVAGLRGTPNLGHYAAAKHGVVGLVRTLALELARDRIRVNSVHPTQVDTPMIQHQTMYDLWAPDLENPGREVFAERSASKFPLQIPWLDPVDVSNALLFLASDEARYITGVTLPIDAGSTLG